MRVIDQLPPRAAHHSPPGQESSLVPPSIPLECSRGGVKFPSIGFDDQPTVSPDEVRLDLERSEVETGIDPGGRKAGATTECEETTLHLGPGSPCLRVELIHKHTQPRHSAAATTSCKERLHLAVVEDPQHLCLAERLPDLEDREHTGKIQEGAWHAGARDGQPL